MHTEQTLPYITIWTTGQNTEYYSVRPGKVKKPFLDNTHDSHGYNCQPMTTINQHGWEFLLPQDVTIVWDGIHSTRGDNVKILEGEFLPNGQRLVDNSTANGTITFDLNAVIQTHPDYYILLSGSPNYFVDGAVAMNALVRTDWYHHNSLQFCWKLTKANVPITFKKDTPFLFVMLYPKNLIENTQIVIKKANQEILDRIGKYSQQRNNFYDKNKNSDKFAWSHMYKNGVDALDETKIHYTDGVYRPNPQKPILEKDNNE